MSLYCWDSVNAYVCGLRNSSYPGYLAFTYVSDPDGVVRLRNFSLIKFFHNVNYSRKNIRETNIILTKSYRLKMYMKSVKYLKATIYMLPCLYLK